MNLRVKELPTLIPQINKAMATCTCRFPWLHMLGLPSRITDLCYACWSASPLSSAVCHTLCHTQAATLEQDGHCCTQGVIRNHSRIQRAHNHDPLLAGQPYLHPAEFFTSSSSIKAERESSRVPTCCEVRWTLVLTCTVKNYCALLT